MDYLPIEVTLNIYRYFDDATYLKMFSFDKDIEKIDDEIDNMLDNLINQKIDLFTQKIIKLINHYIYNKKESIYVVTAALDRRETDLIITLMETHFNDKITFVPGRRPVEYVRFQDMLDGEYLKWKLAKYKHSDNTDIDNYHTWCIHEYSSENEEKNEFQSFEAFYDQTKEQIEKSMSLYNDRNFLIFDINKNILKIVKNINGNTLAYDELDNLVKANKIRLSPLFLLPPLFFSGWDYAPRTWSGYYYTDVYKIQCAADINKKKIEH